MQKLCSQYTAESNSGRVLRIGQQFADVMNESLVPGSMFFDSQWYLWENKLAVKFVNYMPVDRYLGTKFNTVYPNTL